MKNSRNIRKKNIAVILGDPRKPDKVKLNGKWQPEDFIVIEKMKDALSELKKYEFVYLDDHDNFLGDVVKLRNRGYYFFNLCDEGFNNEPELEAYIPEILEKLELFYTGASGKCMKICYDKDNVRNIAKKNRIRVADAVILRNEENLDKRKIKEIGFPLIVKPAMGDGGFGITQESVVRSYDKLENAVERLRKRYGYNGKILIEDYLEGNEITCGLIGNYNDFLDLPLVQENFSGLSEGLEKICGREAKWDPNSEYWNKLKTIPAELSDKQKKKIINGSKIMFQATGCRDYARLDWRLDEYGEPRLLEVNPNCGWVNDGHLAKICYMAGFSYSEMLENILRAAEKRFN